MLFASERRSFKTVELAYQISHLSKFSSRKENLKSKAWGNSFISKEREELLIGISFPNSTTVDRPIEKKRPKKVQVINKFEHLSASFISRTHLPCTGSPSDTSIISLS